MAKQIAPQETSRAKAFEYWMKAPDPMVTFFKTLDVTNLVKASRKGKKFNMLMMYCIGRSAVKIKEFYILPVGDKLMQYDSVAVNAIVKNRKDDINSCDLHFSDDPDVFEKEYLKYTALSAENCCDRDLSADNMVIGTSAIIETEIYGAVSLYSGFNNPFVIWGRYRKKLFRYYLPVSFQFHHTQMDGSHAGRFLEALQNEINSIR